MFQIRRISLTQFKNYTNRELRFGSRIVGICGNNGVGKTNLLDAIHYICFTKSYFTRLDNINIQHGRQGFRIEAELELSGQQEKAVCILRETGKKEFLVDDKPYERFATHIGRYPCVIIAPDDIQIITGGSEERRRFLDALISQLDQEYLQQLITYNKLLQQRNSLLRNNGQQGNIDLSLLDVIDEQLVKPADQIVSKRKNFLLSFLPEVKKMYMTIAGRFEDVGLIYQAETLNNSFSEILSANRNRDLAAQRTTSGIHRDDLYFSLDNQLFRNIASQGQRKSLLFALKLSEMEVLRKEKGFSPLLLLDDIFEKLDEERISALLNKVCMENEGQVFITDTNEERLKEHLNILNLDYEILLLS